MKRFGKAFLKALKDRYRIAAKKFITKIFESLLILVIFDIIIVTTRQQLADQYVAYAGLISIFLTLAVIWFLGGLPVDSFIAAKILGPILAQLPEEEKSKIKDTGKLLTKAGRAFVDAVCILIFSQTVITLFFLVFPIWKFWIGFLILLLVLISWAVTASLARAKWDWKATRAVFIIFTCIMGGIIFLVAAGEFFGFNAGEMKNLISGAVGKLLFVGLILTIIGSASKKLIKMRNFGIALTSIVAAILFFWPEISSGVNWAKRIGSGKSEESAQAAQARQLPPEPPKTMTFKILVEPDQLSERVLVPYRKFCVLGDGPKEVRITNDNGNFLCYIGDRYPQHVLAEFRKGVRFIGPASEIRIYVTPKC